MHILVPEKHVHTRQSCFLKLSLKSGLVLPLLGIFSFQDDKNLPTSFLYLILLLHFLATPFFSSPLLLSFRTVLMSFLIFPLIPLPNIVLTFLVLHSFAQHTNLTAGPPEEFLACDYPLIFHLHTHTGGGNKLLEWALLFYCSTSKVYCFLLQGDLIDLLIRPKMSKYHWFAYKWSI